MYVSEQAGEWRAGIQFVLSSCLIVGLCLVGIGCGGAGSNGGGGGSPGLSAPSGLSGSSGNGEISLSWDAVDAAESYNVYRSSSSTSETLGNPLERGVSSASYTDVSVENGTTYYYRVTAVEGDDAESDGSGEVEVTPFAEPPTRP